MPVSVKPWRRPARPVATARGACESPPRHVAVAIRCLNSMPMKRSREMSPRTRLGLAAFAPGGVLSLFGPSTSNVGHFAAGVCLGSSILLMLSGMRQTMRRDW